MTNARIWIEHNPETGCLRPWEVYFQAEGFTKQFISSNSSEEAAEKSLLRTIKRNKQFYNISN